MCTFSSKDHLSVKHFQLVKQQGHIWLAGNPFSTCLKFPCHCWSKCQSRGSGLNKFSPININLGIVIRNGRRYTVCNSVKETWPMHACLGFWLKLEFPAPVYCQELYLTNVCHLLHISKVKYVIDWKSRHGVVTKSLIPAAAIWLNSGDDNIKGPMP